MGFATRLILLFHSKLSAILFIYYVSDAFCSLSLSSVRRSKRRVP
jgi:hypothetical protein